MEASGAMVSGYVNNVDAVRRALEAAGVDFTNGNQPGVRLRKASDQREWSPVSPEGVQTSVGQMRKPPKRS
jgi:hypothetical protein